MPSQHTSLGPLELPHSHTGGVQVAQSLQRGISCILQTRQEVVGQACVNALQGSLVPACQVCR